MVKIAAENPMFRDATRSLLGPRVDLRGASANVNGFPIKTNVLKDHTKSEIPGENVTEPGKSFFQSVGNSNPGVTGIGSDTLFEIQNDMALLDFGQLSPVERSRAHSISDHDQSVGPEAKDTGQTPVKIKVELNPGLQARQSAIEGTFEGNVPRVVPNSFVLPRMASAPSRGKFFDMFA